MDTGFDPLTPSLEASAIPAANRESVRPLGTVLPPPFGERGFLGSKLRHARADYGVTRLLAPMIICLLSKANSPLTFLLLSFGTAYLN